MARTEAQKRARRKYDKKCRRLVIMLYPTDAELIRKIDSVESYNAYIKGLIQADIDKR